MAYLSCSKTDRPSAVGRASLGPSGGRRSWVTGDANRPEPLPVGPDIAITSPDGVAPPSKSAPPRRPNARPATRGGRDSARPAGAGRAVGRITGTAGLVGA